jgi:predicted MFS family arabinose efflux permease
MPTLPTLRAAFVFACAIAVVNGLGRFAYALLLPVMRADLAWDYTLAGWLNTANSFGYGVGALAGLLMLARVRPATLFVWGLAVTALTLVLCGFTRSLGLMMLWRFLSGVGSAWVFACGGALVAAYYSASTHPQAAKQSAAAIAVFYAGGGLGIALSGVLLHPVLDGTLTWQVGWLALGGAAVLLALWPSKLALATGGNTGAAAREPLPLARLAPISFAYFLFGVGYIVYLTFVVAWLRDMRLGVSASVGVWVLLGLAVTASGWVWRWPMGKLRPTHTFAAATLCTALGMALPLFAQGLPWLLASAVLVGGSFFMVPSAIMALTRASLPATQWAKAMNYFTLIFALGQGIGPVVAGWVADMRGLNAAMATGVAVLLVSVSIALVQRR